MVRDIRIKDYVFRTGSLTASSAGLFSVFSDHTINGTIQNITLEDNNWTTTGSILIFTSGGENASTNVGGLIITLRAGSSPRTYYPILYGDTNQAGTGSPQAFIRPVINSPLRVVGSGLGDGTSGTSLIIRYI